MKKKIVISLLVVCLIALSACGAAPAENQTAEETAASATEYYYDNAVSFCEMLESGIKLADTQLEFDKSMWSISGYKDTDDVAGPFLSFDSGTAENLSKLLSAYSSYLGIEDKQEDPAVSPMLADCNLAFSIVANMMIHPSGEYSEFLAKYDEAHNAYSEKYSALTEYLVSVGAMETEQQ